MRIERPTYILDERKVKENIARMAAKANTAGVLFRPHFKTHQSRRVGEWFREAGVAAITVSSLSMAQYFAEAGWKDITVAFPVNLPEISLIRYLAAKTRLGLLVEDAQTTIDLAAQLSDPVDLYIKIDCGYHRTGLELSDADEIRKVIQIASGSKYLIFKGLLTHAGHSYGATGPEEIRRIGMESLAVMQQVRTNIGNADSCLISFGDTPSCSLLDEFPGAGEIRPGNFVLYDLMQTRLGSCTFSQVAGIVACPVVAVHRNRGQAVIYGGAVHLSKDRIQIGDRPVFGQLMEWDGTRWGEPVADSYLVSLSQEHGILEAPLAVLSSLKPGQIIGIIPVHSCLTANLLRSFTLLSGETLDHMQGN